MASTSISKGAAARRENLGSLASFNIKNNKTGGSFPNLFGGSGQQSFAAGAPHELATTQTAAWADASHPGSFDRSEVTGGSESKRGKGRSKFSSQFVNTRAAPSTGQSPRNEQEASRGGRGGAEHSRNISGIVETGSSENYTGKLKNALGAAKKSKKKSADSKSRSPGKAPTHGVGVTKRREHYEAYNKNTTSLMARVQHSEGLSVGTATDTGTATSRAKLQSGKNLLGLGGSSTQVNQRAALTKQELRELKAMTKNREMFQMMGRTQTSNNKQYLTSYAQRNRQTNAQEGGKRPGSRGSSGTKSIKSRRSSQGNFRINETIRSTQNFSSFTGREKSAAHTGAGPASLRYSMYYNKGAHGTAGSVTSGISPERRGSNGDDGVSAQDLDDLQLRSMIRDVNAGTNSQAHLRASSSLVRDRAKKTAEHTASNRLFKIRARNQMLNAGQSTQSNTILPAHNRIKSAQWNALQTHRISAARPGDLFPGGDTTASQGLLREQHTARGAPKLKPLDVAQANTLSLLGPGSIVSPQNRQAITDAKNSARGPDSARKGFNYMQKTERGNAAAITSMGLTTRGTEAASKIGGGTSHQASVALLNRDTSKIHSMMPSSLAKTQREAGEILNRYGGLSGNLYSTSRGSRGAPSSPPGDKIVSNDLATHSLGLGTATNSISELPIAVAASTAREAPKERPFDSDNFVPECTPPRANEQAVEVKPMSQIFRKSQKLVVDFAPGEPTIQEKSHFEETEAENYEYQSNNLGRYMETENSHMAQQAAHYDYAKKASAAKKKNRSQFFPAEKKKMTATASAIQTYTNNQGTGLVHHAKRAFSPTDNGNFKNLAPQKRIEAIKKQTANVEKFNDQFRKMIEDRDLKYTSVSKNIIDLKKKAVQANSDKIELMRDLATYECNYQNSFSLRYRLSQTIQKVQESRQKLKQNVKFRDGGPHFTDESYSELEGAESPEQANGGVGQNGTRSLVTVGEKSGHAAVGDLTEKRPGLLKDSQIGSIFGKLMQLQANRRTRVGTKKQELFFDVQDLEEETLRGGEDGNSYVYSAADDRSSPLRPGSGASQPLNALGNSPGRKKKGALGKKARYVAKNTMYPQALSLGGPRQDDDELYQSMIISGINCIVQARNANGVIRVTISSEKQTRRFNYDLPPPPEKKTHIDVKAECARLFYGLKRKQGKDTLMVFSKDSIEQAERVKSYLIRLRGAFTKHLNVDIESKNQKQTFKVTLKTKEQVVTAEISYDQIRRAYLNENEIFRNTDINKLAAKYIESEMCIYANTGATDKKNTALNRKDNILDLVTWDKAQKLFDTEKKNLFKQRVQVQQKRPTIQPTLNVPKDNLSGARQKSIQKFPTVAYPSIKNIQAQSKGQKPDSAKSSSKQLINKDKIALGNPVGNIFHLSNPTTFQKQSSKVMPSPPKRQENEKTKARVYKGSDQMVVIQEKSMTIRRSISLKVKKIYETIEFKPLPIERKDEAKTTDWLEQQYIRDLEEEEKQRQNDEEEAGDESIISKAESCNEEARNQYKLELQLLLLKYKFKKDPKKEALKQDQSQSDSEVESTAEEQNEQELEQYDLFYGLGLAKSMKKYNQFKQLTEKQKALDLQKEQEQGEILDEFFQELGEKIELKNRETEKNQVQAPKKKYFRQPKIYQGDYIDSIQQNGMITKFIRQPDDENPEYEILYLYFRERREHFLLLGREEFKAESSQSEASSEESAAVYDSDDGQEEDVDDDSPYFVKITLDGQFLMHLKEPNLVNGQEMENEGSFDVMMQNSTFNEIVRRELDMMFGTDKPKQRPSAAQVQENPDSPSGQSKSQLSSSDEVSSLPSQTLSEDSSGSAGTSKRKANKPPAISDKGDQKDSKMKEEKDLHCCSEARKTLLDSKLDGVLKNFSQILNFKSNTGQ